jgi:hypothetical protein
MEQAAVQDERNARKPPRTPVPKAEKIKAVGSGSSWREPELDRFRVTVRRGVDVKAMIPDEYFDFSKFEEYNSCIFFSV